MRSALAALVLAALLPAARAATAPSASDADGLRARHGELRERLERSGFGRPLALESRESGNALRGDVHAVLDHPFAKVRDSPASPASWCEVLTLPFNVQRCEARGETLEVFIGRKPESPIDEATRLQLRFSLADRGEELLRIRLEAPSGPAGTTNYRIAFEATPLPGGKTFVHMGYGYSHGTMARLAMQAYLSTAGADKVGFTTEGQGVRGVLERNTMRYFLAIDAYLDALDAPEQKRKRARLEKWFASTEKYPRQLREMTREKYLALKD